MEFLFIKDETLNPWGAITEMAKIYIFLVLGKVSRMVNGYKKNLFWKSFGVRSESKGWTLVVCLKALTRLEI